MSFKHCFTIILFAAVIILCPYIAKGQTANQPAKDVAGIPVNYDEALVGTYTLPDPLKLAKG